MHQLHYAVDTNPKANRDDDSNHQLLDRDFVQSNEEGNEMYGILIGVGIGAPHRGQSVEHKKTNENLHALFEEKLPAGGNVRGVFCREERDPFDLERRPDHPAIEQRRETEADALPYCASTLRSCLQPFIPRPRPSHL